MRNQGFLLLLITLFFGCTQNEEVKVPNGMNVLFILADDLGYHDLGITGSKFYETPNIDRIGENGVQFTQGYATCQVCSPSRASIMTGKYPARLQITDWIGAKTGEEWREQNRHDRILPAPYNLSMDTTEQTLAEALKAGGYNTFFAGKWHLGSEGSSPEDHGFEINKGGWRVGSPWGGFFDPFENPKLPNRKTGESLPMRLAHETSDFIQQKRDKPFFAFLSFYAVHAPLETSENRWKKYSNKAENLGIAEKGFKMEQVLPIRTVQDHPVYAGLLENMDEAIGLVLETLEREGILDSTIVVFTSDNGGVSSGDAYATSNSPLRGGKGYQWEGGIREPFFIWIPNQAPKSIDIPTIGTDFYPTILDLVGLNQIEDQHVDGKSLLPLIKGNDFANRSLFWHYPHYGNQGGRPASMIRTDDWKLIYYWEDESLDLFNLKKDPMEQSDLANIELDRAEQMRTALFRWLVETDASLPTQDTLFDAGARAIRDRTIREELWPRLEKRRMEFLDPNFNPDNLWWDSQTID